jgi:prepilin peptidase CpaA
MVASALAGWLIVVSAFDLSSRRVPNWLVGLGLAGALFCLYADTHPFDIAPTSALVASLGIFGVFLIFYATGSMGAGDVKFAAVLGLWLGQELLPQAFVIGTVLACLHASMLILIQTFNLPLPLRHTAESGFNASHQRKAGKRQIPYAAYLAWGGLASFV